MSTRIGLISSAESSMALAAVAGLLLVAGSGSPSVAASAVPASKSVTVGAAAHDVTDFSAVRRRYYRRGPSAAGMAFMGMATGLIAGAIAEQRRREYYENRYYYGYGPGPYYGYGGPGYVGSPYYGYGPRYYYPPY